MTASAGIVTVFGSINMDIVLKVERFPQAGETIIAHGAAQSGGGKGANQAIAAARAGAAVRMIGRVGDDPNGDFLLAHLQANGIDCAQIAVDSDLPTGMAYVAVNESGENQIVVSTGANAEASSMGAGGGGVLLAQLELPVDSVAQFFRDGGEGSRVILNAAPFVSAGRSLFGVADLIIVNEIELAGYCNSAKPPECRDETAEMARSLLENKQQHVITTRGKRGSITISSEQSFSTETPTVNVVDTTGAGDCFCGFLAAQLSFGSELKEAVRMAHRAAAIAVSRLGASNSIPTMHEVTNGN